MCTNSARLVNSLECYMDDLVDCFEDFVKKSLIIISVAVGALIVMLGYILKLVSERSQVHPMAVAHHPEPTIGCTQSTCSSAQASHSSMQDDLQKSRSSTIPQKSLNNIAMPCIKRECKKTTSAAANTNPQSSIPSFDERVLRNIGLSSCSKSCVQGKRSMTRNCSASRIVLPSIPNCIPNHHLSAPRPCSKFIAKRNSCCSMCCADDDRR